MEITENKIEYKVSTHCKQRYAERIVGKENTIDVNRYVTLNEDKIHKDINKMIEYGELIYTGRQAQKDGKGNIIDVFLKDMWIILADTRQKNVITIYKPDLGLGDDFNKDYVSKMMDKLNDCKSVAENIQQQVQSETTMYKEMIEDAESQIREYKTMIKNLEELCTAYRTIVENNQVKVSQANRDVAEVINMLVKKKEF